MDANVGAGVDGEGDASVASGEVVADAMVASATIAPAATGPATAVGPAATPTNAEVLTSFVTTAAALFFLAEEGQNPGVQTYWDALHYIATSLSVGYANIFPCTQAGKVIGAVVQMVGPALSAKALDEAKAAEAGPAQPVPADPALLAKLDEVLVELRRGNGRA